MIDFLRLVRWLIIAFIMVPLALFLLFIGFDQFF